MNAHDILDAVDSLLAQAAADPSCAEALLEEATRLLRELREQRELEAMLPSIRYLYNRMDLIQ